MWNRLTGHLNEAADSQRSNKSGDSNKSKRRSSESSKKASTRGDDRERGFNPTSTSYSSTTRSAFPNTAPASVASSHAYASSKTQDVPCEAPNLIRNASLADSMPKSRTERSRRDEEERGAERRRERSSSREKTEARERRRKGGPPRRKSETDRGLPRAEAGFDGATDEHTRGVFEDQISAPGFAPFPGQTTGGFVGGPPSRLTAVSSRPVDQFPGQMHEPTIDPARKPLAINQGGPGLAADYYGDAGQSVSQQPGVRIQSPSLIIGAEPHLQPASATAAPPTEPSATGNVGAAASFYSGNISDDSYQGTTDHHRPSTSTTAPSTAQAPPPTSSHQRPTLGSVAAGAAAGYMLSNHGSSYSQRPEASTPNGGAHGDQYSTPPKLRPQSQSQYSHTTSGTQSLPSKHDKPSQSSHNGLYAAGAAGAAGLAAASYHQHHSGHGVGHHGSTNQQYHGYTNDHQSGSFQTHNATNTAQRHRHHGPIAKIVDFFKDPDGVAEFEEYTEYIGVCRACFDPRSSPRDAPRKHRYRRRRSDERLGSNTRVDKLSRYSSSEDEKDRKGSWLGAGVAGFGLAKVGGALFNQRNDFEDTYSAKSGRRRSSQSPSRSSHVSRGTTRRTSEKIRRRSRSKEKIETGITSDGKLYRKEKDVDGKINIRTSKRRSSSSSRSSDGSRRRRSNIAGLATSAAVGSVIGASSSTRRRNRSPREAATHSRKARKERDDDNDVESVLYIKQNQRQNSSSPSRARKSKKSKKKSKGFFSFSNSSLSSTNSHLAFDSDEAKSSRRRKRKSKDSDHRKAEAAVVGLGAAAAALAAREHRKSHRTGQASDLVGSREPGLYPKGETKHRYEGLDSSPFEDEAWESATEGDSPGSDSDLAYGASLHRKGSRSSMSSDSSGLSKWGWRWGDRTKKSKQRREAQEPKHSSLPAGQYQDGAYGTPGMPSNYVQQQPQHAQWPTYTNGHYLPPRAASDRISYGVDTHNQNTVPYFNPPDHSVPIHQPQPVAPIAPVLQKTDQQQMRHAPEPIVATEPTHPPQSEAFPSGATREAPSLPKKDLPGSFPNDGLSSIQNRRVSTETPKRSEASASSPILQSSTVIDAAPKRQKPQREDSTVRFELTEEQSDKDRRERRRRRREERERRDAKDESSDKVADDSRTQEVLDSRRRQRSSSESNAKDSWVVPAAMGVGAAAIAGAALATEKAENQEDAGETAEERRERRRRKRQERSAREAAEEEIAEVRELPRRATDPVDQKSSSSYWQAVSKTKPAPVHEDYATFFAPAATLSREPNAKETNPDPNAGVDFAARDPQSTSTSQSVDELTHIVPPIFNEHGEETRPFRPQDWVPRLKLSQATPAPSEVGSVKGQDSPIVKANPSPPKVSRHSPDDEDLPQIIAIEPETAEITIIEPKGVRDTPVDFDDDLESYTVRHEHNQQSIKHEYPDDPVFAATIAAGLADAGFDPEIAINDPTFRRRDSPPGSEEYHPLPHQERGFVEGEIVEPGAMEEEEDASGKVSKRERRKKDKKAKRRSTEDRAAESAIIQDYEQPSVVTEEPGSVADEPNSSIRELGVVSQSPVINGSSQTVEQQRDNASSIVDALDQISQGANYIFKETFQQAGAEPKSVEDTGVREIGVDTISQVTDQNSEAQGSLPTSQKEQKGSLWNIFRKARDNPAEPTTDATPTSRAEEPDVATRPKSRKSKKSKSRKDENDPLNQANGGGEDDLSTTGIGRISQDLPAQVQPPAIPGRDPSDMSVQALIAVKVERPDELQSGSFLGERPEPPPPPDEQNVGVHADAPASPVSSGVARDPMATPHDDVSDDVENSEVDGQHPRLSEIQRAEGSTPVTQTSSPTAVPYFFRMPASPGTGRTGSLPQTPSRTDAPQTPQRPKIRPKSIEFRYSTEFRPLWLVERHKSRQDEPIPETFPSLPSSHTTSRASSVHDPEENYMTHEHYMEKIQAGRQASAYRNPLAIDTSQFYTTDDLLDSQQATPTASSFPSMLKEDGEMAEETLSQGQETRTEAARVTGWENFNMEPLLQSNSIDFPQSSSVGEFKSAKGSPPLSPTSNVATSPVDTKNTAPETAKSSDAQLTLESNIATAMGHIQPILQDSSKLAGTKNLEKSGSVAEILDIKPVFESEVAQDPSSLQNTDSLERTPEDSTSDVLQRDLVKSTETPVSPKIASLPQDLLGNAVEVQAGGVVDPSLDATRNIVPSDCERPIREGEAMKDAIQSDEMGAAPPENEFIESKASAGINLADMVMGSSRKSEKGKKGKKQLKEIDTSQYVSEMPNEDPLANLGAADATESGVEPSPAMQEKSEEAAPNINLTNEDIDDFVTAPAKKAKKGKKGKTGKQKSTDTPGAGQDTIDPTVDPEDTKDIPSELAQQQVSEEVPMPNNEELTPDTSREANVLPGLQLERGPEMTQSDHISIVQPQLDTEKPDLEAFIAGPPSISMDDAANLDVQEAEYKVEHEGEERASGTSNLADIPPDSATEKPSTATSGFAIQAEETRQVQADVVDLTQTEEWAGFTPKKSKKAKKQKTKLTMETSAEGLAQGPIVEGLAAEDAVAAENAVTAERVPVGAVVPDEPNEQGSTEIRKEETILSDPSSTVPDITAPIEEGSIESWQPKSRDKKKKKGKKGPSKKAEDQELAETAVTVSTMASAAQSVSDPVSDRGLQVSPLEPLDISEMNDGSSFPVQAAVSSQPDLGRNEEVAIKDAVTSEGVPEETDPIQLDVQRPVAATNTAEEVQSMLAGTDATMTRIPSATLQPENGDKDATRPTFEQPSFETFAESSVAKELPEQASEAIKESTAKSISVVEAKDDDQHEPEISILPPDVQPSVDVEKPTIIEEPGENALFPVEERPEPVALDRPTAVNDRPSEHFDPSDTSQEPSTENSGFVRGLGDTAPSDINPYAVEDTGDVGSPFNHGELQPTPYAPDTGFEPQRENDQASEGRIDLTEEEDMTKIESAEELAPLTPTDLTNLSPSAQSHGSEKPEKLIQNLNDNSTATITSPDAIDLMKTQQDGVGEVAVQKPSTTPDPSLGDESALATALVEGEVSPDPTAIPSQGPSISIPDPEESSEDVPKSKKDKKKRKKAKQVFTFDEHADDKPVEDDAARDVRIEGDRAFEQTLPEEKPDLPPAIAEDQVKDPIEDPFEDTFSSKKSKKKGKKGRSAALIDDDSGIKTPEQLQEAILKSDSQPTETMKEGDVADNIANLVVTASKSGQSLETSEPKEPADFTQDGQPEVPTESLAEPTADSTQLDEAPLTFSKKDRKKGKKAKLGLPQTEDQPPPETAPLVPYSLDEAQENIVDAFAEPHSNDLAIEGIEDTEATDRKRDKKKKGKQGKRIFGQEDPFADSAKASAAPATAVEELELPSIDRPAELPNETSIQAADAPAAVDDVFPIDAPKDRKKKGKKSKLPMSEESALDPKIPTVLDGIAATDSTKMENSPQIPVEVMADDLERETTIEGDEAPDLSMSAKTRKDKKKGKKKKALMWDEPIKTPHDESAEQAQPVDVGETLGQEPAITDELPNDPVRETPQAPDNPAQPATEAIVPTDASTEPLERSLVGSEAPTPPSEELPVPITGPIISSEEPTLPVEEPSMPSTGPVEEDQPSGVTADELTNAAQITLPEADDSYDANAAATLSKRKKDKKKGKKSKAIDWDEPEEPISEDVQKSAMPEAFNDTAALDVEGSSDAVPGTVGGVSQDLQEQSYKSKKDKKKAKRGKSLSLNELIETPIVDVPEDSMATEANDFLAQSEGPDATSYKQQQQQQDVSDELTTEAPKSKKSKKKSKKNTALDLGAPLEPIVDDDVTEPTSPVFAGEEQPTDIEVTALPPIETDIAPTNAEDPVLPESTRLPPIPDQNDLPDDAFDSESQGIHSVPESVPTDPIQESLNPRAVTSLDEHIPSEAMDTMNPTFQETSRARSLSLEEKLTSDDQQQDRGQDAMLELQRSEALDQPPLIDQQALNHPSQFATTLPEHSSEVKDDALQSIKPGTELSSLENLARAPSPLGEANLDKAEGTSKIQDIAEPEPVREEMQDLDPEPTFTLKKSKKDKKKAKRATENTIDIEGTAQGTLESETARVPVLGTAEEVPTVEAIADVEPPNELSSDAPPLPAVDLLIPRKKSKKDKKRESRQQSTRFEELDVEDANSEPLEGERGAALDPETSKEPAPERTETLISDVPAVESSLQEQVEPEADQEFTFSKKSKKDKKKGKKSKFIAFDEPTEEAVDFTRGEPLRESVIVPEEVPTEPRMERPITPPFEPTVEPAASVSGQSLPTREETLVVPESSVDHISTPIDFAGSTEDNPIDLNVGEEFPEFSNKKKKKGKKANRSEIEQSQFSAPQLPADPENSEIIDPTTQEKASEQLVPVDAGVYPVETEEVAAASRGSMEAWEIAKGNPTAEEPVEPSQDNSAWDVPVERSKKGRGLEEPRDTAAVEDLEDLLMKPASELTEAEHQRISEIPAIDEKDIEVHDTASEREAEVPDVLLKPADQLTETERQEVSQLPQPVDEPIQSSLEKESPLATPRSPAFEESRQQEVFIVDPYPTLAEQGASDLPTIKEGQVLVEENRGQAPSLDDRDRFSERREGQIDDSSAVVTEVQDKQAADESKQDDEFPMFITSKKGKKGKKNKKKNEAPIYEDETATPPVMAENVVRAESKSKDTEDIQSGVQQQTDPGLVQDDPFEEPTGLVARNNPSEVAEETKEVPEDDAWPATTEKKSKKSKKGKRRQEQVDSRDLSPTRQEPLEETSLDQPWPEDDREIKDLKDFRVEEPAGEGLDTGLARTAGALGAAAVGGAILSQQEEPKKQSKKDKKRKKSSRYIEEELPPTEDLDKDGQVLNDTQITERDDLDIQNDHEADPATLKGEVLPEENVPRALEASLDQQPGINRDSGIIVEDSPTKLENLPTHRIVRDSGYQGADDSPVVGYSPEHRDYSLERDEHADEHPLDEETEPREARSRRKRRPRRERDVSETYSDKARDLSASHEIVYTRSQPTPPSADRSRSSSFSQQMERAEHSRSREADVHQLQTEHFSYDSPREPSPVSSTTKDRSSVLFHSSPSNRHDPVIQQGYSPPQSPALSAAGEGVSSEGGVVRSLSQSPIRDRSPDKLHRDDTLQSRSPPAQDPAPRQQSIFGGPIGERQDMISPPQSPYPLEGSRLPRLDTITEYSPEESPLHKKSRPISDVGSPERGVKSLRRSRSPRSLSRPRIKSPGVPDTDPSKMVTSTDLDSRLSWPTVDEDKHSVDLERSRSRNTDKRRASRLSEVSTPVMTLPKPEQRSASGKSDQSIESINAIIRTPPEQVRSASGMSYRSSGTPPLRRSDRSVSSDLRLASKKSDAKSLGKKGKVADLNNNDDVDNVASSSTYDPVTDKGKTRLRDMADVYVSLPSSHHLLSTLNSATNTSLQEGLGHVPGGSPLSPTRPPSMRRRQSMQILDLEQRLDQVVSESRILADGKLRAERILDEVARGHAQSDHALREAIETRDVYLNQKNQELEELRHMLDGLQNQVAHLNQINQGLSVDRGADEDHEERYRQLEADHGHTHEQWQQSTRELEDLRQRHASLSDGMESVVATQVASALAAKNAEFNRTQEELHRAREELDQARQQIRDLQQQILASKSSAESLNNDRDEDYFDTQCQALCQHVQQWVLRFSKSSDDRQCFLASEIRDEKICDRFENAILDGTDADTYLADRVKRRDVFMSVFMTMVWEYIFTRYLFGMDREQRQKLKSLEKTLNEVGPGSAVQKWRATTLSLLSKRDSFAGQRSQDTEAVVHEIYGTLSTFLPPPPTKAEQLQISLRRVVSLAADLSIEMRIQKSEYIMLPPLQPEFDTNGDLARYVYFNANLMNERSGSTISNEALEQEGSVVKMVLFPLVVKKGDGDEEIVVCPAQVLCQEKREGKKARVVSGGGDEGMSQRMGDGGSTVDMGGMF